MGKYDPPPPYFLPDGPQDDEIFLLPVWTTPARLEQTMSALHAYWNSGSQEHIIDLINAQPLIGVSVVEDIRIENGILQKKFINDETWYDVGPIDSETILGAEATTLAPGEPATASLNAGILSLGIPRGADGQDGLDGLPGQDGIDGQSVESVAVSTLTPGESATAALVGTQLQLGIPRGADGAGIDDVLVWSLEPGETPTVDLTNGLLQLSIPRGQDGQSVDSVTLTLLPAGEAPVATLFEGTLELKLPQAPAPQMRVYDGWVEWKHENQVIWNQLISLAELEGDGINDVVLKMLGPDDTPYAVLLDEVLTLAIPRARDGVDANAVQLIEEMENDTLAHICSGVRYALDFVIAVYLDIIGDRQLIDQDLEITTSTAIGMLEGVTGGAVELIPIDEFFGFLYSMRAYNAAILQNRADDPYFKEQWANDLYCRIVENGNRLTESIYEEWADSLEFPNEQLLVVGEFYELDLALQRLTVGDPFIVFLKRVWGFDQFLSRYNMGYPGYNRLCAQQVSNCGPGHDWCITWTGSEITNGLQDVSGAWSILDGQSIPGGVASAFVDYSNLVSISLDFDRAALVRKISVTLSGSTGIFEIDTVNGVRLYDAGILTAAQMEPSSTLATPFIAHLNHIGDEIVLTFFAGMNADSGGSDPGGQVVIEAIELCGMGDHPLAWCHRFNYEEVPGNAYPVVNAQGNETAAYLPGVGWVAQPDAVARDIDPNTPVHGIQLVQPLPTFNLVSVRLVAELDGGDVVAGENVISLELGDGTLLNDVRSTTLTPAGGFTSHQIFNPAETNPALVSASIISREFPSQIDARGVTIKSVTVCGLGLNPFTAPPPEEDEWPEVLFNYDHCVEVDFRIDQSEYWTIENSNGVFVPDVGIVATYTGVNNYRAYLYSSQVTSATSVVGAALQATPLGPGFAEQTALHFKGFLRTGNFPTEEYTLYEFNPPGTTIAPEEIRIQMEHRTTSWGNPPGPASQFTLIRARFYFLGDNPFPNLPSC